MTALPATAEPPAHPTPEAMAGDVGYSATPPSIGGAAYMEGIRAERARLVTLCATRANAAIGRAKALIATAPATAIAAIEAAELVGEARALRLLAAELAS